MSGWIKIHRSMLKWEWFDDIITSHLFLYLLLTANYERTKWRGRTIERGQLLTGRKKLKENTRISEQSIRTSLERLKSTNEITIESTKRFSIITICNYERYQQDERLINQQANQQANQQLTNSQPTSNQQLTTSKEYNNNNNTKKDKNIRIKGAAEAAETIHPRSHLTELDLPHEHRNTVSQITYGKWLDYRAEAKLKRWTKSTELAALKKFPNAELLDAAVKNSIASGYQGLFLPSTTNFKTKTDVNQIRSDEALERLRNFGRNE